PDRGGQNRTRRRRSPPPPSDRESESRCRKPHLSRPIFPSAFSALLPSRIESFLQIGLFRSLGRRGESARCRSLKRHRLLFPVAADGAFDHPDHVPGIFGGDGHRAVRGNRLRHFLVKGSVISRQGFHPPPYRKSVPIDADLPVVLLPVPSVSRIRGRCSPLQLIL